MTLLHLMKAQKVRIQNLDNNPGILPFKLGTAKIKIATHTFLHYINLTALQNQIDSITYQYEKLEDIINSSETEHKLPLFETYKHLSYEVNVVNQKLKSISPANRQKRGLINPLGSLVKYITGNLDQQDAKEINNNILELENKQNKIINKVNKQISLTSSLMTNINQTMTVVSKNQKAIENKINEIANDLQQTKSNYVHYLEIHEIMDQIKLNLDSLLNFLNDIENAISFASLKTLHHSIIPQNELKEIVKEFHNSHHNTQLLFKQNEYLNYYEVVETNVFAIENRIVFSLDFPLVHSDTFEYYHLYSVPNKNQSIIIPPSTYLTLSTDLYQYQNEECIDLKPNYFCKNNNLLPIHENPDCITALLTLSNKLDQCQQVPVHIQKAMMEEIDSAHYIGIFPEEQRIQTNCVENEVSSMMGTHLFTVPPKCSIKTPKYEYKNEKDIFHGHPVTLDEIKSVTIPVSKTKKIKLEKIPLDKLHELQLQSSTEDFLEFTKIHQNTYINWLPWILITAVLIGCIYFAIKNNKMKISRILRPAATETLDETQVIPPSSSF